MCVLTLGAVGCVESECAAGCYYQGDEEAHIDVQMDPPVPSDYHVDLDVGGVVGAFVCERPDAGGWRLSPGSQTGSGQAVDGCTGAGFTIIAGPDFIEISISAQDGSWTGSVMASPVYERHSVCGTLCAPGAEVIITRQ